MSPSHFLQNQTTGFLELSLVFFEIGATGEEPHKIINQKLLLLISLRRDQLINIRLSHLLKNQQFPKAIPHLIL